MNLGTESRNRTREVEREGLCLSFRLVCSERCLDIKQRCAFLASFSIVPQKQFSIRDLIKREKLFLFLSTISLSLETQKGEEQMWQNRPCKSSFRESVKALEADLHHANSLAATLPGDYCGDCVQMRLSYSPFAPIFLFLIEWMDYSCMDTVPSYLGLLHILINKVYTDGVPAMSSKERKASLREFYAVIYPSLRLLEGQFKEVKEKRSVFYDEDQKRRKEEVDRDDECGICMESQARMVLPSCGHSLCISCFHDWNIRSKSCPYCRGSLKRVSSGDLWVLTSYNDVVDTVTVAMENLQSFYLYIENLPTTIHDTHVLLFDYMI